MRILSAACFGISGGIVVAVYGPVASLAMFAVVAGGVWAGIGAICRRRLP